MIWWWWYDDDDDDDDDDDSGGTLRRGWNDDDDTFSHRSKSLLIRRYSLFLLRIIISERRWSHRGSRLMALSSKKCCMLDWSSWNRRSWTSTCACTSRSSCQSWTMSWVKVTVWIEEVPEGNYWFNMSQNWLVTVSDPTLASSSPELGWIDAYFKVEKCLTSKKFASSDNILRLCKSFPPSTSALRLDGHRDILMISYKL